MVADGPCPRFDPAQRSKRPQPAGHDADNATVDPLERSLESSVFCGCRPPVKPPQNRPSYACLTIRQIECAGRRTGHRYDYDDGGKRKILARDTLGETRRTGEPLQIVRYERHASLAETTHAKALTLKST